MSTPLLSLLTCLRGFFFSRKNGNRLLGRRTHALHARIFSAFPTTTPPDCGSARSLGRHSNPPPPPCIFLHFFAKKEAYPPPPPSARRRRATPQVHKEGPAHSRSSPPPPPTFTTSASRSQRPLRGHSKERRNSSRGGGTPADQAARGGFVIRRNWEDKSFLPFFPPLGGRCVLMRHSLPALSRRRKGLATWEIFSHFFSLDRPFGRSG